VFAELLKKRFKIIPSFLMGFIFRVFGKILAEELSLM